MKEKPQDRPLPDLEASETKAAEASMELSGSTELQTTSGTSGGPEELEPKEEMRR